MRLITLVVIFRQTNYLSKLFMFKEIPKCIIGEKRSREELDTLIPFPAAGVIEGLLENEKIVNKA